ncbi:MAG: HAD family phosphatase [Clostridia bacterium]
MDIKGAIFDLDGTLVDTMPVWENIGYEYISKKGFKADKIDNYIFKNLSLHQSALYFKQKFGVSESVEQIIDEVSEMTMEFYCGAEPREGAVEFLQFLEACGAKACVATATERPLAEAVLKANGMMKYIDKIYTCTEIGHGKDESIIYDMALEYLGSNKNNTLVFEDALHAAKTAIAADYKVVGIYDPSEAKTAELEAIAYDYIKDYYELEWFSENLTVGVH